jgi:hypothetical protein
MDVIIVAFTVLSWSDMREGILFVWKVVLVVGLGFTLAGTVGLAVTPSVMPLLAVSIYGWMLLPAAGLAYTGRAIDRSPRVYLGGAALSVLGTVVYVGSPVLPGTVRPTLLGLGLVGLGQTAGIAVAVRDY